MLSSWLKRGVKSKKANSIRRAVFAGLEPLESRRLLSGSPGGPFGGPPPGGGGGFGPPGGGGGGAPGGPVLHSIAFSLAPTAVQTGLDALATADNLTDPTATTIVDLNNINGVETYSVTLDGTGTVSRLTVDQLGDPVTAPTQSTTTWATLDGSGTGSDAAAAAEILAIATAQNLTAPTDTTVVNVLTTSGGSVTYSVNLAPAASNSSSSSIIPILWKAFGPPVTVDAAGNPVGQQRLPFSVFSTTIQNGLNNNAPAGATAYNASSTQPVVVRTTDGITTYSVVFTATGTQTQVTVDAAGDLTSLPSTSTTTFSALSSKVQTELQTLATADGVTTTIASNQSINVLTETNGTIIYSATLGATGTDPSGGSYTFDVTISVDSNGNPTTPPQGPGGIFGPPGGGDHGRGPISWQGPGSNSSGGSTSNSSSGTSNPGTGGPGGGDCGPGSNSNSSSGSTSNSGAGTISLPGSGGSSTTSTSTLGNVSYTVSAKLLTNANFGLTSLGGYFVEFVPPKADAAVQSDLTTLAGAQKQLAADLKGLSSAQRKTLVADDKAIAAAIKAMASTLAPLEATLKSDATTWAKTLHTDKVAIAKDRKNASALATAQAKLTSDEASAFAAIVTDEDAIQTAIGANAGVAAAQTQLATDLPTIASDESTIKTDQQQLQTDVEAQLSAT